MGSRITQIFAVRLGPVFFWIISHVLRFCPGPGISWLQFFSATVLEPKDQSMYKFSIEKLDPFMNNFLLTFNYQWLVPSLISVQFCDTLIIFVLATTKVVISFKTLLRWWNPAQRKSLLNTQKRE